MSDAVQVLILFALITILLPFIVVNYRTIAIVKGKAPPNAWTRNAQTHNDAAFITRLQHAHLNCLENLPVFAALVLAAAYTQQLPVINAIVWIYFAFRLAQVVVHSISAGKIFVLMRATCYVAQVAILIYWALALLNVV